MATRPKLNLFLDIIFIFILNALLLLTTTTSASTITTLNNLLSTTTNHITNQITQKPKYYSVLQSNNYINYTTLYVPNVSAWSVPTNYPLYILAHKNITNT
eukprot:439524_1